MKKIILLILIPMLVGCSLDKQEVPGVLEVNFVEEVLGYNIDGIDESFLNWIQDKYGEEKLKELNEYLKLNEYDKKVWHEITGNTITVLYDLYNGSLENTKIIEGNSSTKTISFIGDISLADNFDVMPYYDSRGGLTGILDQNVIDFMNSTDLMVANSEFTISDRGTPMKNKIYTFRALPSRVSIYDEMGIDLVTLANNHVFDFGSDAFLDMMDILDQKGIPHVGAGRNIYEAMEPYYFIINGYKVGFINATRAEKYILTPEAGVSSPGVFRCYDPTNFIEKIKETKANSDYVVALIHWGKEDSHDLEQVQIDTGKQYIDAGADVLIGSHAHVLQGIEFYNGKPIVYNLGDFIFNRETKETGIFNINVLSDGGLTYSFIPCMQDNYKTSMLEGLEYQKTIDNMNSWSINAKIDNDGNVLVD